MTDSKITSHHKKQNPSLMINGIHLHSKVDPLKEAEIFCEKYENEIYGNSQHIILGLGLGYHLNELIKRLFKAEIAINITVLEPNAEIIENYREEFPHFAEIPGLNFYTSNPEDLFLDDDFINKLYNKPAILVHKSSYDANKEYFYAFLTYRPNKNMSAYKNHISHNLQVLSPSFQGSNTWGEEEIKEITSTSQYNLETVFWTIYSRI